MSLFVSGILKAEHILQFVFAKLFVFHHETAHLDDLFGKVHWGITDDRSLFVQ